MPKPNYDANFATLDVHLIPHSHTDPGWLKTYDAYYNAEVKTILTAVAHSLDRSPNRTFVWAETCFFERWWREQSARRREKIRRLVARGQLEFVGGGWVQHDEAAPTLSAMAEQLAAGHAFLNATFGVRPRVGWQIDPFGHSRASAAVHAAAGYDAIVLNRVHFNLKRMWRNERRLEFRWTSCCAPPIIAHILYLHYSSPKGYNFEGDAPLPDGAVSKFAERLRGELRARADAYRSSQLMVLLGDDFSWQKAEMMYAAWEKLAAAANAQTSGRKVRVFFSTPSRYFAALRAEKTRLPTYSGELMPYADNERSYWTYAARRSGLRALRAQASRAPCAQANEPRLRPRQGVLHDSAEAQAARARRRRDRTLGRVDVRPRHRARRRGGERRRRVGGGRRRRPVRRGVDVRRRAVRRPRERPPRCGARPAPRRHHGDVAQ